MTQVFLLDVFLRVDEYSPVPGQQQSEWLMPLPLIEILTHSATLLQQLGVRGRASLWVHIHVVLRVVSPRCLPRTRNVNRL